MVGHKGAKPVAAEGRGAPPPPTLAPLVPIPGDANAVSAATLHNGSGDPISLKFAFWPITPSWAKAMLQHAIGDERIENRDVKTMAEDIANMRWRLTGDPIVIDERGRLVKGRKRLTACIVADTPFVSLVLAGVNSDSATLETSGTGKARRLADILKIAGFEPHRSLATALPLVWRLRTGTYEAKEGLPGDLGLLELLHANPEIRDAMAKAQATEKGRIIRLPLFASMVFLLSRVDRERTLEFVSLMTKDGLAVKEKNAAGHQPEGHPVRTLNDIFLNARAGGKDLDRSLLDAAGTIINAYNAFVTGIPPKAYRWRKDEEGAAGVPFPRIEGWTEAHNLPVHKSGDAERKLEWTQKVELTAIPESELTAPAAETTDAADEVTDAAVYPVASINEHDHPLTGVVWQQALDGIDVPQVALETIGPAEAEDLLVHNTNNRNQQGSVLQKYRRDMESGTFASLNGQTIKVGMTGRLLDAQHRLESLRAAGVSLPFVVVRGLPEAAFDAMDRGRSMSFRQVLERRGLSNAGIISSAARLMWHWERSKFANVHGVTPSIPELSETIAQHPGIADSLHFANHLRKLLTPAAACWVEYMLASRDPAKAKEFLSRLSTGEDLSRGNPVLVLRDRLIKRQLDTRFGALSIVAQSAICFIAWNAWYEGKTIRNLSWMPGQAFPAPIGGTAPTTH